MSYNITTFCIGQKYEPILPKWSETIQRLCTSAQVRVFTQFDASELSRGFQYAWWDVVRLKHNVGLMIQSKQPVTHVDLDVILKKNIEPIVRLPYDIIISTEIGGSNAFPKECSQVLGFGMCSGFYVIKPSSLSFMLEMLRFMKTCQYNSYSDQVTLMNYVVNTPHTVRDEPWTVDGVTFVNKVIEIDGVTICVLDFGIVTRDPILNAHQFANHINIDNVGGTAQFLRYFDEDLETLPLTCRCGKRHLGDAKPCVHLQMRPDMQTK